MKKYYLGIDYSLNKTGWIILNHKMKIKEYGSIENVNKLRGEDRLRFLFREFNKLIKKKGVNYEAIGIEDYSHGSKGRVFSIGEGGGILRLILSTFRKETGNNWYAFSPSSIKKSFTGKGKCEKSLMLKYAYKRYKVDIDDDDIIDAYAVARLTIIFHSFLAEGSSPLMRRYNLKDSDVKQLQNLVKKLK